MNTLEGKGKVDYNFKEDILYFYIDKIISKGEHKYSDSIDIKGFILDVDNHKHVIGLELLDASKKLNVDKMALKFIKEGKFKAEVNKDIIMINFSLISIIRNKIENFTLNAERTNNINLQESGLQCEIEV